MRPVEIGNIIEDDDSWKFQICVGNPTKTPKCRQLLAEAYKESRHFSLSGIGE